MSEAEAWFFCEKCGEETIHFFSGSLTKGSCDKCGNELPKEQKADLKKVISYNG